MIITFFVDLALFWNYGDLVLKAETHSKPQSSLALEISHASKNILWSVKNKGYGWKSKVAIGPNRKAIYLLPLYLGLFHTMKMFKKHINNYLEQLVKDNIDAKKSDNMPVDDNNEKNM